MQVFGYPLQNMPQVAGHPLGLPGDAKIIAQTARVQPILDARNPETALGNNRSPRAFWHLVRGEPDPAGQNAPPSVMQLKISRMLNDQATELKRDDAPEARQAEEQPGPEPAFLPFETRKPQDGEEPGVVQPQTIAPEPRSKAPVDAAARGYEESANLSRSSVFSTLP